MIYNVRFTNKQSSIFQTQNLISRLVQIFWSSQLNNTISISFIRESLVCIDLCYILNTIKQRSENNKLGFINLANNNFISKGLQKCQMGIHYHSKLTPPFTFIILATQNSARPQTTWTAGVKYQNGGKSKNLRLPQQFKVVVMAAGR